MLTLLGGRARTEVFPEIKPNVVTVQAVYPGATPAEVEQGVCQRVEEAIAGVTGIDKITATANEGAGMVMVETLASADLEQVYSDIKNRVDAITTFPVDLEQPIVSRLVVRKEIVNVDFGKTMSLVGLVGDPVGGQIIAEGRYARSSDRPWADTAFVVDEAYKGRGIASFMRGERLDHRSGRHRAEKS